MSYTTRRRQKRRAEQILDGTVTVKSPQGLHKVRIEDMPYFEMENNTGGRLLYETFNQYKRALDELGARIQSYERDPKVQHYLQLNEQAHALKSLMDNTHQELKRLTEMLSAPALPTYIPPQQTVPAPAQQPLENIIDVVPEEEKTAPEQKPADPVNTLTKIGLKLYDQGLVLELQGNDREALAKYRIALCMEPENQDIQEAYEAVKKRL